MVTERCNGAMHQNPEACTGEKEQVKESRLRTLSYHCRVNMQKKKSIQEGTLGQATKQGDI